MSWYTTVCKRLNISNCFDMRTAVNPVTKQYPLRLCIKIEILTYKYV